MYTNLILCNLTQWGWLSSKFKGRCVWFMVVVTLEYLPHGETCWMVERKESQTVPLWIHATTVIHAWDWGLQNNVYVLILLFAVPLSSVKPKLSHINMQRGSLHKKGILSYIVGNTLELHRNCQNPCTCHEGIHGKWYSYTNSSLLYLGKWSCSWPAHCNSQWNPWSRVISVFKNPSMLWHSKSQQWMQSILTTLPATGKECEIILSHTDQ